MSGIRAIHTASELVERLIMTLANSDATGFQIVASAELDGQVDLVVETNHRKAVLHVMPQLYPSRRIALEWTAADKESRLLACARIPDQLAADFRAQGINHADLNGRLFIRTPWYLLDREPRGDRFRNPTSAPDLFSGKSARIVRALLSQRNRIWTQEELTSRTEVSRGLVSRVLTALAGERYIGKDQGVSRTKTPAIYRVAAFDALLDAWAAADRWSERVSIQAYSLLDDDPQAIAAKTRDALGADNIAFTQWFAAWLRHPYTTPPLVSGYVRRGNVPEIPFARPVSSGGNLWLLIPGDEGIFFETQEQDGFRLVSDVQVYLDLLRVEQRGPDQAKALREWPGFCSA